MYNEKEWGKKPKLNLQLNFDCSLVHSFKRSSLWHCHFDVDVIPRQFIVRDRE